MEITRALIAELSQKEKPIQRLVKEFQSGEINEDELVSRTISYFRQEYLKYREEFLKNESQIW